MLLPFRRRGQSAGVKKIEKGFSLGGKRRIKLHGPAHRRSGRFRVSGRDISCRQLGLKFGVVGKNVNGPLVKKNGEIQPPLAE